MGAPSKRARKIRSAPEFDIATLSAALRPPPETNSVWSWTLENIFDARNQQMRGNFSTPAKLAASMRTNQAFFVARANRLAPQRCIKVEVKPAKGAGGAKVANEADALYGQGGVAITPGTLADINGCLVDHGVAFAANTWTPRDDGSRIDGAIEYWPVEHVRWDAYKRCFVTRVDPADSMALGGGSFGEVEIRHGDGRWIIFATHDYEPFRQEAAVLVATVWATHAFAMRDWAKSSVAHGSQKVIGALPEGVALQKTDGTNGMTEEAAAMVAFLRSFASDDAPVGLKPAGSTVDFVASASNAWQVFDKLAENAEKAAARIYLGTDGTLGAAGGAPGVDITALFGVALTKVQGDLAAITRGLQTGAIEIWTALNFGDSTLAPTRRYMLPDADEDAARESTAKRTTAFYDELDRATKAGVDINQAFVDKLATKHGIDAPKMKVSPVVTAPAAVPLRALGGDR